MTCRGFVLAAAIAAVLLQPGAAAAGDHDRARRAYEAGEVVALRDILARVNSAYEGRVLEVELQPNRRPGARAQWVYGVRMLTPQGHVLRLELDARTTAILNVRGRGADAARRRR